MSERCALFLYFLLKKRRYLLSARKCAPPFRIYHPPSEMVSRIYFQNYGHHTYILCTTFRMLSHSYNPETFKQNFTTRQIHGGERISDSKVGRVQGPMSN